jgi:hypothetical protein
MVERGQVTPHHRDPVTAGASACGRRSAAAVPGRVVRGEPAFDSGLRGLGLDHRSVGSRADMVVYQQYVNDITGGVTKALATVDPTPFFVKYGNNVWAASQQYLAAVVAYACGPVIKKYLGVLAAADVHTASTAFAILESIRLDLGFGSQVHP